MPTKTYRKIDPEKLTFQTIEFIEEQDIEEMKDDAYEKGFFAGFTAAVLISFVIIFVISVIL